jgi:hypothetical protein
MQIMVNRPIGSIMADSLNLMINYVSALQTALGNNGASMTVNIFGQSRSATVTGPSSAPVATGPGATGKRSPAVILSLSPGAQATLNEAEVALTVISDSAKVSRRPDATAAKPASGDTTSLPEQNPPTAASISNMVAAAGSILRDPASVFYEVINSEGGPEKYASYMADPQERASFVQAFNDKTLSIQNASDVAGLNYTDSTSLTGTSETANEIYNTAYLAAQNSGANYASLIMFPAVGGIYFSWARSSANASADTTPAASG